jgi:hypothetical protein
MLKPIINGLRSGDLKIGEPTKKIIPEKLARYSGIT